MDPTLPPQEKAVPSDLLYVGHQTEKSVGQVLVPGPPITRSRVIFRPLSRVREWSHLFNDHGRRLEDDRDASREADHAPRARSSAVEVR